MPRARPCAGASADCQHPTLVRQGDRNAGLYNAIWRAFAVLLPVKTVGVMGDARSYDFVCALRAVTSTDGMTADYFPFPHEILGRAAARIIDEVRGINRIVYDITSNPPAQSNGSNLTAGVGRQPVLTL